MEATLKIRRYLEARKTASGREIGRHFGISRQAVNKHLKVLIQSGRIVREGRTRGAIYKIAGKIKPPKRFSRKVILKDLEEDKVFKEIDLVLNLRKNLKQDVFDIINYAFTEILNNAIEHSRSKDCDIEVSLDQYKCNFTIRDKGVGIFYSIQKKYRLPSETTAVGELIKGKTTTMKEKHTGEGVFFTSKSADNVGFRSHRLNLIFDNIKKDIFMEGMRFKKGTEVFFGISRTSKRKLDKIFKTYAPEEFDYSFEKTRVFVKLFHKEYVSRSEAKRMLSGLDKFKEIVLDFKGVKSTGQGFLDEIFRVFHEQYPEIVIKTENLNPAIAIMIKHVVDNKF